MSCIDLKLCHAEIDLPSRSIQRLLLDSGGAPIVAISRTASTIVTIWSCVVAMSGPRSGLKGAADSNALLRRDKIHSAPHQECSGHNQQIGQLEMRSREGDCEADHLRPLEGIRPSAPREGGSSQRRAR